MEWEGARKYDLIQALYQVLWKISCQTFQSNLESRINPQNESISPVSQAQTRSE